MRNAPDKAQSASPTLTGGEWNVFPAITRFSKSILAGTVALIGAAGETDLTMAQPPLPASLTREILSDPPPPVTEKTLSDMSPKDIMTLIDSLGSKDYRRRLGSTNDLTAHFNRDIMVLLAPVRFSDDLETKRRAEHLLPEEKLRDYFEKNNDLPLYLKDHWPYLHTLGKQIKFRMTALSGARKGDELQYWEMRTAYRTDIPTYPLPAEWTGVFGNERRALWTLCRERHDAKALDLLHRNDADLKTEWQDAKTGEDFASWKISRFRTGMREIVREVEESAVPFIEDSDAWRKRK